MTVVTKQLPEATDQRIEVGQQPSRNSADFCDPSIANKQQSAGFKITLLTGGGDKPYALGLAAAVTAAGVVVDFIGSDELDVPELVSNPRVNFLNLRGNQCPQANRVAKMLRILKYYVRLIHYAATAESTVFHILWNNKFELIDRTLLMLYYKMMRKRLVLTAHNVNTRKRDGTDSFLNRLSLRIQYSLSDHIFVHSERMKAELVSDFGRSKDKVSVIPFGINNTVPNTALTIVDAKHQLGVSQCDKTLLFFGNITPYKGLEYLITAFARVLKEDNSYRLIIAGRVKGCENYWRTIEQSITSSAIIDRVIQRIEYVPDEETELYFKAADVLVLPYTRVFQSGVLLLGYAFGLPAVATNVGALADDIIAGRTGLVCEPSDPEDLARAIRTYFNSELYENLEARRAQIREFANEQYSWTKVGEILMNVYRSVLRK
jgi:D-inositol-3-phosphate glycosyltransferase